MGARKLEYNPAQLVFIAAAQRIKIGVWGRGTGKSTILGRHIRDCVVEMPRSTGALVAKTFRQIETRTLPSTIKALEDHGLIQGIHFFVGKKPPTSWHWPNPYEGPLKPDHAVWFWNGTVMVFVSQDHASSGRGLNIDWVVGDEAAMLDEEKFNTDVLLTNRGNETRLAIYPDGSQRMFRDCPLHHSIVLMTSQPITRSGQWIFKFEEQAILNPEKVCFTLASAEVNRKNLSDTYFEDAKAIMPDFLYEAEVENKRMKSIQDGFYPLLDEDKHGYNAHNYGEFQDPALLNTCAGDADHDTNKPLLLTLDWGANINCLVVCQHDPAEFRAIKNFYVKHPQIIDDLIDDGFAPYYESHANRMIYLYYDPSGNVKVANSKLTYAQQVQKRLEAHGWTVQLMTNRNHNILHGDKYNLWNDLLSNKELKYPAFKINLSNCPELWISMQNAPAKQGHTEAIRKDKSSERKKGVDQAHATHFSDAIDVIVVDLFLLLMLQTVKHVPVQVRS
jgi:hypothetical protein